MVTIFEFSDQTNRLKSHFSIVYFTIILLCHSVVNHDVTYVHDRYGPGDEMDGILGPFRMTRSRLIGDVEMTRSSMAGSDFDTMYMMMI